jgi:hypothetical protein
VVCIYTLGENERWCTNLNASPAENAIKQVQACAKKRHLASAFPKVHAAGRRRFLVIAPQLRAHICCAKMSGVKDLRVQVDFQAKTFISKIKSCSKKIVAMNRD